MRRAVALLLLAAPFALGVARAEEESLTAGFEKADLTPSRPVRLAGYDERNDPPVSRVRDRIEARAMVLQQGDRKLAIVSADLFGIPRELKAAVLAALAGRGFHTGNLLLAATGNRSAPGGLSRAPLFRGPPSGFDPEFFAVTAQRIAEAIARADDAREPARLKRWFLQAPQILTVHGGRLPVVRVDDAAGTPRGLLVIAGANPGTGALLHRELTAGWAGAASRLLETRFPGCTALVLQGPYDDRPLQVHGTNDVEAAEICAKAVATVATHVAELSSPDPREPTPFEVRRIEVPIPPVLGGALLGDGFGEGLVPEGSRTTEVLRIRLAGFVLLTLPGEPTPGAGWTLEWKAPRGVEELDLFVVGGANDQIGTLSAPEDDLGERVRPWADLVGPAFLHATLDALRASHSMRSSDGSSARELASGVYSIQDASSHGAGLRDRIRDLLRAVGPRLLAEHRTHLPSDVRAFAEDLGLPADAMVLPWAAREAGRGLGSADFVQEMRDVAHGAGVPYESILLENLRVPSWLPGTSACATGSATTLGQAVQWAAVAGGDASILRDRAVVLVREPREGYASASVTWPGMVGAWAALGAQGLSVAGDAPDVAVSERRLAPPTPFLVRYVAEHCQGLSDATRVVTGSPGVVGRRITVVDGNLRQARVLSTTGSGVVDEAPVDGLLAWPAAGDATRWLERSRGHLDAGALGALAAQAGMVPRSPLFGVVLQPQTGRIDLCLGDDLEPDPATGVLAATSLRLADLLSPAARAPGRNPPLLDKYRYATEGAAKRFSTFVRIPVEFDSLRPSGVAHNDRVHAALFLPADPSAIRGAVIQLPAWREHDLVAESLVASSLASQGFATFLMPLPWQVDRAAQGVPPGAWTLSPDLARTREAWMQGLTDVLWASEYLEREHDIGPEKQAVFGISLGGHVAAVAYGAYPDRFRAGVFVLAGGDLELLMRSQDPRLAEFRNRVSAAGVNPEDVKDLLTPLDPVRWADPARRDGVFLVGARGDEIVPAAHVEALSNAYGKARILWIDGDHTSGIAQAPRILAAVIAHLKARLGGS